MRIAIAVLACVLTASPAASEWTNVKDMNAAIDGTNFVVGAGCSGTLISIPEKLILTAYHCIEQNVTTYENEVASPDGVVKKVRQRRYVDVPLVQFTYDGYVQTGSAAYVGEIIAEDQKRDLAIIQFKGKIPHTYASPLLPDTSEVMRGEKVYVVGNPAMNYGSVVEGIVSSVNRTFEFSWTKNEKLAIIQFSGGIVGGNSGGALYNAKGEVIGVPIAMQASSVGFATPVTVVKKFMRDNCLVKALDPSADDVKCKADKAKKDKSEKDN